MENDEPRLAAMPTLQRDAFATLKDLCSHLETHSLFHTFVDPNAATTLCIHDLPPFEYHELFNHIEPLLEGFRIKIDFHDTTLILCRPSYTYKFGAGGWHYLGNLLQTQMPMPPPLKQLIWWHRGQPDITLPPLSIGGLRIKCPDACLGSVGKHVPTLVLETGYTQTPAKMHAAARSWLHRIIHDETEALEEGAVQCVILWKINGNLPQRWLPAFRESYERHGFNRDLAPNPTSFLSKATLQSIALAVAQRETFHYRGIET